MDDCGTLDNARSETYNFVSFAMFGAGYRLRSRSNPYVVSFHDVNETDLFEGHLYNCYLPGKVHVALIVKTLNCR